MVEEELSSLHKLYWLCEKEEKRYELYVVVWLLSAQPIIEPLHTQALASRMPHFQSHSMCIEASESEIHFTLFDYDYVCYPNVNMQAQSVEL